MEYTTIPITKELRDKFAKEFLMEGKDNNTWNDIMVRVYYLAKSKLEDNRVLAEQTITKEQIQNVLEELGVKNIEPTDIKVEVLEL